jgi:hypothetical protein
MTTRHPRVPDGAAERSRSDRRTPVTRAPGTTAGLDGGLTPSGMLALQRDAGNSAVAALVGGSAPQRGVPAPPTVQRAADEEPGAEGDLVAAVREGDVRRARRLLRKGEDVNQADEFGDTALILAVERGQRDMVELLLGNGADTEIVSPARSKDGSIGETALKMAVVTGNLEMVRLLLGHGAKMETADRSGLNPPCWAARTGNIASLGLFVGAGWDINWRDPLDGFTLLHYAATAGHLAAVQWLVASGADLSVVPDVLKAALKRHDAYDATLGELTSTPITDPEEMRKRNAAIAELTAKQAQLGAVMSYLTALLPQPDPGAAPAPTGPGG